MAEGMSFDRYIDNPSGGAVFTNRQMYKNMYKDKFGKVLVREQGQIKYTVYKTDNDTDTYYIYFKIPSEVIDNFYYDVVIELYTTENSKKNSASLRQYAVRFYSNDPAFVYTFAYAFKKNKLFIKDLEPKMSKEALRTKADIRNPRADVFYVKSLFFANLAMERYSLFNRAMLNQHSKPYKKKELLDQITPADIKVRDRQREQELLDKKKKEEKERARKEQLKSMNISHPQSNTTSVSKTTKVSKTSKVSKVSKVANTSKTVSKK